MYSLLLLFTLVPLSQGLVALPPTSDCTCINPFALTNQPHLGDTELTCQHQGTCYVKCNSTCGDVEASFGFTQKKGRCISRLACNTLALALNEKSAIEEEPTVNDGDMKVVLSGTGPVTRYQGHSLGMYTYKNETEYYEQDGGDYYLMIDWSTGLWYTFPHISGCDRINTFSCIAQWTSGIKSETLTGTDWSFAKDKTWIKDDSIMFQPLTPDSCLNCATILIASTAPASNATEEYFGTFQLIPSTFTAGRPVYKNKAGKFLMIKNEYTSFSVWDNMERNVRAGKVVDEGERGLRSKSGPTCVTDLGLEWQFVDETGAWVDDKTVTATCQD